MNEEDYKKLIIECVKTINNKGILEYIYTFIKKLLEKWG
jgi:hypothetical protein